MARKKSTSTTTVATDATPVMPEIKKTPEVQAKFKVVTSDNIKKFLAAIANRCVICNDPKPGIEIIYALNNEPTPEYSMIGVSCGTACTDMFLLGNAHKNYKELIDDQLAEITRREEAAAKAGEEATPST